MRKDTARSHTSDSNPSSCSDLLRDEVAKHFGLKDDPQCRMSTSELMTFVFLPAIHFQWASFAITRTPE
jgi:hypothetical protein